MGKQASKHECLLVNAHFNKALEEQIWKKTKTGFNLANYNVNQSLSELSICLEEKPENKDSNIPLKVDLPPVKPDNDASKVLLFDQTETEQKEKGEKEQAEPGLNFEEFECGVHFGSSENPKQEWSFTLYDFDGHGKITKEDLASLLKALYDAIGSSSIKIPSNGRKTLKLRLTVGQDGSQIPRETKEKEKEEKPKSSPKKRDRDSGKNKDKHKDSPKVKESRGSPKAKEFSKLNNLTGTPGKCNNETQGQTASSAKARLSSQEHQQLADLVQENMERNHIKQLRRHHSDCRNGLGENSHHKRRHRDRTGAQQSKDTNTSANNNQTETPKESQDRRNYYLDLAGVENNTSKFQPVTSTPCQVGSGVTTNQHYSPVRHRARSHDTTQNQNIKCDNVKLESERFQKKAENNINLKADHVRSRSFEPPRGDGNTPSPQKPGSKFRPVSLPAQVPEAVSPHYHRRHRHREKDHDMAMQQVAEWIEREHKWDFEGDHILVQRHEHHHIHEHHHHHHYHHYYEA